MDEIIYTVIVAIIVAVIGGVIGWTKRQGYDEKFENIYIKYKLIFDVSGTIVQAIDAQLYQEMKEALAKMKEAYESPEFTVSQFNEIVKECQDVFDRVNELLADRKDSDITVSDDAPSESEGVPEDTSSEDTAIADAESDTETRTERYRKPVTLPPGKGDILISVRLNRYLKTMPDVPDAHRAGASAPQGTEIGRVAEVDGLDTDTIERAWERFKKDNQTSIEDKLDVLLAQNQEIQVDTARTADLVPAVMGEIAEGSEPQADAMTEEVESVEDEDPYAMLDDLDGLEDGDAVSEGEEVPEGDVPESDAQGDIQDFGGIGGGSDVEDEGTESDVEDAGFEDDGDVEDFGDESDVEDEGYEPESYAEEVEQETRTREDETDGADGTDEDEEEPTGKAHKAYVPETPPRIRPIGAPMRKTVISKVDRPPFSISAGCASGREMVQKAFDAIMDQEPIDFGLGTDPNKVVEQDREMLRLMKSGMFGL